MSCEFCKDAGALIMYNVDKNRDEIQRCDACQIFKTDKEAWKSLNPKKK